MTDALAPLQDGLAKQRRLPRAVGLSALSVLAWVPPANAQCPDGTPPPCGRQAVRTPAPAPNSIAVLPFVNRSSDSADTFLAEALPEQIQGRLARVTRLQVKSQTVVAAQWRRTPDPMQAARILRTAWLVTGTVRRSGRSLTVVAELVQASSGDGAWGATFRRDDDDLAAIEEQVAESVAVAIVGRLVPAQASALRRMPSRHTEAYRLYLYGRVLVARRTPQDIQAGVDAFSQALRFDDRFASAWARLAIARCIQVEWGSGENISRDSLLSLARTAADRALALDSGLAEAWLARGQWAYHRRQLGSAHEALAHSLHLDTLDADAYHALGYLHGNFLALGDEAERYYRRALELNPDLRTTWQNLAQALRMRGRLAEAEAMEDSALSRGPWAYGFYARALIRFERGNGVGARADLSEAIARLREMPAFEADLDSASSLIPIALGDSAPARRVLAGLRARVDSGMPGYGEVAQWTMVLGLRGETLGALERLRVTADSAEPRCSPWAACSSSLVTWRLLHEPVFAPLHGDPRFERLWQETRPVVPWLEGYH